MHKSIVIVGAGPVGMVAAIKMAACGYTDITILDAHKTAVENTTSLEGVTNAQHGRVLALSYASARLLEEIDAWDNDLVATAIKQVHISHSGFGISQINASDVQLPDLGYTIKYSDLCNKLYACLQRYPQIKLATATVKEVIPGKNYATVIYAQEQYLTADLVLLAEGGQIKPKHTSYKEHDYQQSALVATLKTELKHNNIAFERFDDCGTLAFLPYKQAYILIWSSTQHDALYIQDPEALAQHLKTLKFMKRFGKFEIQGKPHTFPLKLQVAKNRVQDRVVLLGNSAQIVHPISAQGLNLGLRDVATLVELIDSDTDRDINKMYSKIAKYDQLRVNDSGFAVGFTHFLAKFKDVPYTNQLCSLGLIALSNCKRLRNKLTTSLIFGN